MVIFWLPNFCSYVLNTTPVFNECFKGSFRNIYIRWNIYLIIFYNIPAIHFSIRWIFNSKNIRVYLGTQPSCASCSADGFWKYAYFYAIRHCSPISHPLFRKWEFFSSEYPHSWDKTLVRFGPRSLRIELLMREFIHISSSELCHYERGICFVCRCFHWNKSLLIISQFFWRKFRRNGMLFNLKP
jgi:hypothetical protein